MLGVAPIRDLKRWLQFTNKKLEATNKLRQYVVESMAKQRNFEMKLASTKSSMDELDNSNNVLQASIQTFQIECEDLKKDRKRKVEEIERLHLQIN